MNDRNANLLLGALVIVVILLAAIIMIVESAAQDIDPICYENQGVIVQPTREMTNLLISVNWFDTLDELESVLERRTGEDQTGTEGYSECETYAERDIGWCEIWVVRPTYVLGDPNMDSLGHEVLHGLMGDYHP